MRIWTRRTKVTVPDDPSVQVRALIALTNQNVETSKTVLQTVLASMKRTDRVLAVLEDYFRAEIAARQREKEEAEKRKPTEDDHRY
jgi:hypothetical protein